MKVPTVVMLIMLSAFGYSQTESVDLENFAERLFQIQDEDLNYQDIYESLLYFYSNKLNLNKATPEQLASLYILNQLQTHEFFDYREKYGRLLSIHELQVIPSFDLATIRKLLPFVTIKESIKDSRPFLQRLLREENNYLLLRFGRILERERGYTSALPLDTTFVRDENMQVIDTVTTPPQRYLGSPNKIYGRFRISHPGDFSLGFTFEKDEGEPFEFRNNKAGFDFYSYHLLLEHQLGFNKIVLGDYQLQVGQGLVFGAGFNTGKGSETVNSIKRNTIGILPYTSVLEVGFFRGIGLTKKIGNIKFTGILSGMKQGGSVQSDTTFSDFQEFIGSIQQSGLHRTSRELALRNRILENNTGGVVEYSPNRRFSFGASYLYTQYSTPIQRRPNNYNQFEFKGNENHLTSSFFHYTWQNFTFFGEGAISYSGGIGAVGGLVSSLSPILDMTLLLRNYDRDFHSFYGNALAEGSRNINERGTYWGLFIKPNKRHSINFYYDVFKFPWLRFRTEAPSLGNEWLFRYTYNPSRSVAIYGQVRQQLRQISFPQGNLNILNDQLRHSYILNIDHDISKQIQIKTKVQSSTQREGNQFTKGFAIVQDVNFSLWKFKLNTRFSLFDTDDFDNAQYVYESDVLYSFSIPPYSGQGSRSYFMIRYDPLQKMSLWMRYARFSFRNVDVIRSGLSQIEGNTLSEIKLMAKVSL